MATLRQIRANTENARKNTGSRAPGGAGNARTHGLSASKCLSDEEKQLVEARLAELEAELKPEGTRQRHEVLLIAAAMVRIERCQLEEEDWRLEVCESAEFFWEAQRTDETMELAQKLPKNAPRIQPKLLKTLRGIRWVLGEWRDLACRVRGTTAGGSPGPLDEAGRQRAFDLMGLSAERRETSTLLDPPHGNGSDAAITAHQDTLITAKIAELEALVTEDLIANDEAKRIATIQGVTAGVDHQTRLIRRYETEARRVKERAEARLKQLQEEEAVRKKQAKERAILASMDLRMPPRVPKAPIAAAPDGAPKVSRQAPAPAPPPAEALEPVPAPVPAAPAAKAVAPVAAAAPLQPLPVSVLEEILAETGGMPDPHSLPISASLPMSRRERKAARRGVA